MSLNRKYAALPDLDLAPDVYETPDLIDDASTFPASTRLSASPSSSYQDIDEEASSEIDRQRLQPDQARSQFSPAQVDAQDVDFSDRINGKRKSYKASSRRRRKMEDGTEELGDLSDEEDESLETKLARLRREVEEVKDEYGRRQAEKQEVTAPNDTDDEDGVDSLSRMLDDITISANGSLTNPQADLAKMLSKSLRVDGKSKANRTSELDDEQSATYTVTYAPSYEQNHALAKVADFDTRLTVLEKALGIGSSATLNLDRVLPKAILPTLDVLDKQISTLSSSSASSLDTISRKVRQLTQEAEKLDEARRSAKAAQDALKSDPSSPQAVNGGLARSLSFDDPELVSKVNALYGTLATIENLSPLLPAVLDRLQSLRAIHADAANASENLKDVEKRQEEMASDIKQWTEGLAKIEATMKQGEGTMGGNMKVVEGWVKDLEARVEKLKR
ncbi:MAG: hypothetical protein M1830_006249 [Pleopsidium flavum]|nr:MAG: hypothetical protein M1830_006249 [Pleopsidium flavum]